MNTSDLQTIQTIVRETAPVRGSLRALQRTMAEKLKQLHLCHAALAQKTELLPWEQWLYDNFYALEGHAKQAIADLRGLRSHSAPLYWLYQKLSAVFSGGEYALSGETIEAVLSAANDLHELGERQLDFVYTALKCTLLQCAAAACGGDSLSAAEREKRISFAVMHLNAIYELNFDAITRHCSVVEAIFLQDPSGTYPKMTETSRAHYRRVTARIAQWCGASESDVARDVLSCAKQGAGERDRHVGFYLLNHDPQTAAGRRRGVAALLCAWLLPLLICALLGLLTRSVTIALLAYLPLVEIVRVLAYDLAMRGIPAGHIPRIELGEDAPKTVVAVSTLLPSAAKAAELKTRLEQLYFSNSGKNLYFCVLADFKEDRRPYAPQDDLDIAAAKKAVEALNAQYGSRFMLFLRRRSYCATQNSYAGWERKRGAITEFIRFLKGGETTLCCFVGDRKVLPELRYLLALDADTDLSFETANYLVSAAAHPLNRPVVGRHQIVTEGYGILVPRLTTDLKSAKLSDFTRIMAGAGGVSAYEQESCDFYQDLFGRAIFSGKGLVDIDAFHQVVGRRFPENTVLSHDILEGAYLRAGLVSDVEMTDGIPSNALSWFTRLHRWIRGDWQNLIFLGKTIRLHGARRPNPIGPLSRYQLIDNLRRSLVPVMALLCVLLSCFTDVLTATFLCSLAFFSVSLPPLLGAVRTIAQGGRFSLTRRYFTRILPYAFELLGQGLLCFVMAAQQALVVLDAVGRTLWRLLRSRRNLLQWTTAAQGETRQTGFFAVLRRSWLSELMSLALLIFTPSTHLLTKLCGALFLLYAPAAAATARPVTEPRIAPTRMQRERILSWCAKMFRYYEDYANEENHFLPPDNVQVSPTNAIARRTSPTNIGMMLLSLLAARDFHFIDSAGLAQRLCRTLDTIEALETYRGNLYNWYATDDLRVLPERFVSAVDSGNYLCALVALKQGLQEYMSQEPNLNAAIARIEALLKKTDFSIFYDKNRKLLSIGIDGDGNRLTSHYDFLMSEARTASYYAIAMHQAPRRHWRALNRTMSRSGVYAGPVSWTGTMFEYFMPHLLLPVYEGSLLGEALHYAVYCQKRKAARAGVPWGISESGYFAFDEHLNYQYKAHGIQALGVKQELDRECVVSPYSSFLVLPFDLDGAMKNLSRLEKLGLEGRCGFYEAIDFTAGRCSPGGAVVRSYMAHHVGMSMVACANVLFDHVMQKRFMRDRAMGAAREFLQEKIAKDTVVYDEMKSFETPRHEAAPKPVYQGAQANPLAPAWGLLSNGEMTHFFSDTGNSFLRFSDTDVTRRSDDPLLHSQGVLAIAHFCGQTFSAAAAPFYQDGVEYRCEFTQEAVIYRAQKDALGLEQRFTIDRARPVERCKLTLRNGTSVKAVAEVLFYLEPVLSRNSEYAAHPAFSKLFLVGEREPATGAALFSRRHRDGGTGPYLAVGFDQRYEYGCALRREDVTPYPEGMEALMRFPSLPFDSDEATPDGCCALRLMVTVPARGEKTIALLLSCGETAADCLDGLAAAQREKPAPAPAVLMNDSIAGRLGMKLLPQLMTGAPAGEAARLALAENTRGQDALWTLGISGDLPIVLYDWSARPEWDCLAGCCAFWRQMRLCRLEFDLCVLGDPGHPLPDGVKLLLPEKWSADILTALRAAACHIFGEEAPAGGPWKPAAIFHVSPAEIPRAADRFDVVGGAFIGERFYVDRVTPLPFSHILATPSFGTLAQDSGLGNTWWRNARECKLSPWRNDIASGNDGERLLLRVDGEIYDLCRGARASFSPEDARYEGVAGGVGFALTVTVKEGAKLLDLELQNLREGDAEVMCAYYLEPVLGVSRLTSKYTKFAEQEGCLVMENPYQVVLPCYVAVHVPGEHPAWTTARAAFLAGDWSGCALLPNNDPIAGTVVKKKLPPNRKERIRFILTTAATADAAIALAKNPLSLPSKIRREIVISTPDEPLNRLMNGFAAHQVREGRLFGRCAFYQCSGAYGFRDQLQDVGAMLLLEPALAREQIARCCAVQFHEGDVLHWWHELPGGTKGVRTRFSDDLLWLPLIVADYVRAAGDTAFLDREIAYCTGDLLDADEQERYLEVTPSDRLGTVYDHCIRAIDHAYQLGDQGIPKIGCGDWNDGFSKVGAQGKGQSVWLGMFLIFVLEKFAPLCESCGDRFRADVYRGYAETLRQNIDQNCWDGGWYLRAFYDDGAVMGGKDSESCKIDLLPQSFAALCGMKNSARVNAALDAALERLVDWDGRVAKLFTPPFTEETARDPGYIKAYPPGIRENGGQYTHGAIWLALALLKTGRTEEGWRLLNLLNPVSRCTEAALARAYKLEPYYVAADIYTHSGAYGHGGWCLYTGAAGWYCRTVLEGLLGLRTEGMRLFVEPRIPEGWNGFLVHIREGAGEISLTVCRGSVAGLVVDGATAFAIPLDGENHEAILTL